MQGKKEVCFAFSILLVFILVSLVSAGFFDIFTGKASDAPQDISVGVVGINPVSIEINITDWLPIEENMVTVMFEVNVTDPDGVNDIDDSSVSPEFTNGPVTRTGTCLWDEDFNSTTANYSCSINMWYFDATGSWDVRVQANDFGNGTLQNGTTTFFYTELKAMVISPATLNWPPLIPSATNQNSSNDPTIVNNTGNYNGPISISAYDLHGLTIDTEAIIADAFSVGADTFECTGVSLQNDSSTSSGINSNPGNLSAGGGQAEIYYCIPLVPQVSSQTYSTAKLGSWVVEY